MLALIYIMSVVLFGGLILTRPYLIARPSCWFCLVMLLQLNGAAAFADTSPAYGPLDACYPDAWMFRLASLLFPFGALAWLIATPQITGVARELYGQCRTGAAAVPDTMAPEKTSLWILGVTALVILAVYLSAVPLRSTGLAAIVLDPENAKMAREKSLKLLGNVPVQYAYSLYCTVIATLLAGLLAVWPAKSSRFALLRWPVFALLAVTVMLTGARAPAGQLLFVLAVAHVLRRGALRRGLLLAVAILAAMMIAVLLSFAREGRLSQMSLAMLWECLSTWVFGRVCVTPFLTGIWSNRYALEHGLLGIANIRPLALLYGVPYVNLSNVVALAYVPHAMPSSCANTCFLFDYQASFGLFPGWVVSLVLLCGLDLLLGLFRGLRGPILVAFLAAFMTAQVTLASSTFTTTLLTHGLLPLAVLAAVVKHAFAARLALRRQRPWRLIALEGTAACASST